MVADDAVCFHKVYDRPFAIRMRMFKYIKAFREQMKDKENVDENKYNHLVLTSNVRRNYDNICVGKETFNFN